MTLHSTKVLLDSAVNHRLAGNWSDAVRLSERAFVSSQRNRCVPDLIESIITIAHSYREMSDPDLALEYYHLACTIAGLHGQLSQASRGLNGIAILLQQQGWMDQAESTYREARRLAAATDDVLTTGNIDMNLGTLYTVRGNLSSAHDYYLASLACYERIEDERGVVGVLNNLGMLHIDRGEFASADECLHRALLIARQIGDVLSEGVVQINRTELLISQGNLNDARATCDNAFEIFGRLGEHSGRSEALKHYGVIYRESDKPYLAETHLREAVDIAAKHSYPLQEAEAQRELALVLRTLGRNREALASLNRSHHLFSRLQARQDQADVTLRLTQLESDFLSLVGVWGESIDEKDQYTRGHCQRVATYACRLAEEVGFPRNELVWFRMGALLHDVGKTGVPEEILKKPGELSSDERSVMERHTVLGEKLLSEIEFPWDIAEMIRSHHERWDGAGYPDGLRENQIPLSARILHIADVFDALTTKRSYRLPLHPGAAVAVMRQDKGSFDPCLFRTFESLLPELSVDIGIALHPADTSRSAGAGTNSNSGATPIQI